MSVSERLRSAVAAWLARHEGSRRAGSAALSATYRAGGSSQGIDLGAYLVARLPATFAAVDAVLAELVRQRPELAPASLLDAGAGPGTASWAAAGHWPGLSSVTLLDTSRPFLALAAELAAHGPPALAGAREIEGSLAALPEGLSADLVIASYALAELPIDQAARVAEGLWRATSKSLVLVEPGTPQGFARLRAVRSHLLSLRAVPVAPCGHGSACPLEGDDWCHFSVRLARSRAHMHAKGASVPFEDERYSYLVLARDGAVSGAPRILAPPQQAKPGITFRLCADGRLDTCHVARRDGAAYKRARKLNWGDTLRPATEEREA